MPFSYDGEKLWKRMDLGPLTSEDGGHLAGKILNENAVNREVVEAMLSQLTENDQDELADQVASLIEERNNLRPD